MRVLVVLLELLYPMNPNITTYLVSDTTGRSDCLNLEYYLLYTTNYYIVIVARASIGGGRGGGTRPPPPTFQGGGTA